MTLARWSLRRNNGANTDYRKTCRNRAASVRQFPSISSPSLLPKTPLPYGKQRRTPATPNSLSPAPYGSPVKPATARIIHGAMQPSKVGVNGSGFDDVFFHRPQKQGGSFLPIPPRNKAAQQAEDRDEVTAFRSCLLHDSQCNRGFPWSRRLGALTKTCIGEQGKRTSFWRTKSSFRQRQNAS
ncbi:uncharacterized protein CLUP02_01823 [Colletotrichum lupini]|uniref:Uncharacterized protein n=1 Tax=Colletotrichum lupini TaxID=145971 RepID=A0A9Q8WAA4_9PEZI|nr:uncharacterized protein CLUP02_01823 [Colletotrichum lupini]UQC75170.1 hypothetical protein CLUP02_01823 [Colletotrichum lupini]